MKFTQFLLEASIAQKPRYRVGPDGNYVPVVAPPAAPKKKDRGPAKSPMTAQKQATPELYPHLKPGQTDIPNTLVNTNKDTLDFDPAVVGNVAKPIPSGRQIATGPQVSPSTKVTPQQRAAQQQTKNTLLSKHKPNVAISRGITPPITSAPQQQAAPTKDAGDAAYSKILAIVNQAKKNNDTQSIDQLHTMLKNIQQSNGMSNTSGTYGAGNKGVGVNVRQAAAREAKRLYTQQLKSNDPAFKSLVGQEFAKLAGGRV